jgi:hypothetical protein
MDAVANSNVACASVKAPATAVEGTAIVGDSFAAYTGFNTTGKAGSRRVSHWRSGERRSDRGQECRRTQKLRECGH